MGVAIERKGRLGSWLTDTKISVLQAKLDAVSAEAEHYIGVSRGFVWRLEGIRLPHIRQDSEYWRGVLEGWTEADTLLNERGHRWHTSR